MDRAVSGAIRTSSSRAIKAGQPLVRSWTDSIASSGVSGAPRRTSSVTCSRVSARSENFVRPGQGSLGVDHHQVAARPRQHVDGRSYVSWGHDLDQDVIESP